MTDQEAQAKARRILTRIIELEGMHAKRRRREQRLQQLLLKVV